MLAGQPGVDAGVDGSGALALVGSAYLASDGANHLYFADAIENTVRAIDLTTGLVTTIAGQAGVAGHADGTGSGATFSSPSGIAYDPAGYLYVSDNSTLIREVTLPGGQVQTVAGTIASGDCAIGKGSNAHLNAPGELVYDGNGHLYVAVTFCFSFVEFDTTTWNETLVVGTNGSFPVCGYNDGAFPGAQFSYASALSYAPGHLYTLDNGSTGSCGTSVGYTLRDIDLDAGMVRTLAGHSGSAGSADGIGAAASFGRVFGLAYDGAGNVLIADRDNQTIRRIALSNDQVTTVAGTAGAAGSVDGPAGAASFNGPAGLALDPAGDIFIGDQRNDEIREIVAASGLVTTLAGSADAGGSVDSNQGTAAFNQPSGIAYDGADTLYVSDHGDYTVRQINIHTGATSTLAGASGQSGTKDGTGTGALFVGPSTLAYDPAGLLYVADETNGPSTLRAIMLDGGTVTTVVGTQSMGSCSGTGQGTGAGFDALGQLWYDGNGHLYGANTFCFSIVELDTTTWTETLVAGSSNPKAVCAYADGSGLQAAFSYASALASDGQGNLYTADQGSSFCNGKTGKLTGGTIRKLNLATLQLSTIAGSSGVNVDADGSGAAAGFYHPAWMTHDGVGALYITDGDSTVRRLDLSTDAVTTVLGVAASVGLELGPAPGGLSEPAGLLVGPGPALYVVDQGAAAVLVAR